MLTLDRELKAEDSRAGATPDVSQPLVLLPLEVMVKPLELRFRYHFDGDRPTNKVDKVCAFTMPNSNRINICSLSIFSRTS